MRASRHTSPPVILIGGHDNGLSVARSLGRRGVSVHAIGCGSLLRYSRFVDWIPPEETGTEPAEWLAWLLGPARERLAGAVLFACNDDAVDLLAHHRARLEADYVLMHADDAIVLAMLDKAMTYALAEKIGIPAPKTWVASTESELDRAAAEVSFPCALKPRSSHRFRKHFGIKLFVAADATELAARFRETRDAGLEMLVTEIVPGRDDDYCSYWSYLDRAGRPLFHFTKRKLRQHPIHFGGGTFHVTEWIPEVAELGLRFVTGVGLTGLAAVEFKRDARDGRLKLIECNVRFTSAVEIASRSGIDLAGLVYDDLTETERRPIASFRDGVSLWFPLLDLSALVGYRRCGELSYRRWVKTLASAPSVAWFQWTDPMPALAAVWQRAGHARSRTWR